MRNPHVCIVACQHGPHDARVVHKLAAGFRDGGCRVTWVGPSNSSDSGEPGIEILPFPVSNARPQRPVQWIRAYRKASQVAKVDVYCGVSPDSAHIACTLARRRGGRVIFDLHEVYHEEMLHHWVKPAFIPISSALVRRAVSRVAPNCDLVVGSSDKVLAPYRAETRETLVIRNCAPSWMAWQPPRTNAQRCLTILHGKATMGQSIRTRGTAVLLEALCLLRERGHEARMIVFDNFDEDAGHAGAVVRRDFYAEVTRRGLGHALDVRAVIPMSEMPHVLAEATVGLIAYNKEFGVNSLPGRLFEYMAAALPVVAPEYAGDVRSIVERERCGILVDCEDPASVAMALCWLAEHPAEAIAMGGRGRDAFLASYCWEQEVKPLVDRVHNWTSARESKTS